MAEEILMPKLGLTMTEGVVNVWYKKEGDKVKRGDVLCEIASEKLTNEVEAESDGVLLKILVQEGEEVPTMAPLGLIGAADEAIGGNEAPPKPAPKPVAAPEIVTTEIKAPQSPHERIFISPLAKKMAQEKKIPLHEIVGTGGNGRITKRDVENYQGPAKAVAAPPRPASAKPAPKPPVAAGHGLTGMRKVIATNMMQSIQQTAQVTLQRKVNLTPLMSLRKELKERIGGQLDKYTLNINVFLLKAIAHTIREFGLNGRYDGQTMELFDEVNIGIAVALEQGLIVPNIKHVEQKSLSEIGREFQHVTSAAHNNTLTTEYLTGGTFSITNLGPAGIEYFTPILNFPEIAILGVGAISKRLIFDDNHEIAEIQELPLSLTFDHQAVDGAPASEFLKKLAETLEQPHLLLV